MNSYCEDCNQSSSGQCWRHSEIQFPTQTIILPSVPVSSIPAMPIPLARIPVSGGLYIEYDTGDTWFAICDEDWMSYDRAGSVQMNFKLLDKLIEKLNLIKTGFHVG